MFDTERLLEYNRRVFRASAVVLGPLTVLGFLTAWYRSQIPLLEAILQIGFYGRVIANMLPGLLAVGAAYFIASHFVAGMYGLKSWREGADHLSRCVFGQPTKKPTLVVTEGKIKQDEEDVLVRIGGPARIQVHKDSAAVLECGGRLTRVLGPGTTDYLEPFEKVRDVIDVRPMRWGDYEVKALSKEGIPVFVTIDVSFQISTGGRTPKADKPYPVQPEAVFKAAVSTWVRDPMGSEDDQYYDWARRVVISEAEGILRGILARYPLDSLIGLESSLVPGAPHPRKAIRDELEEELSKAAVNLGAQINEVRIGKISVADQVTQQWIEAWEEEWQNRAMLEKEEGEAHRDRLREAAKTQAQVEMIKELADALERSAAQDTRIPSRLLVMRLIEVFDRHSIGPYTYLPGRAIDTLENLRQLVEGRNIDPQAVLPTGE
jgi:regulator of protease activity HflC (stomatin/prohibitin superfamily)